MKITIIFNKDALVPNESGTDLASVLNNWKENFTDRFDQVVRDSTKCFSLVQTVELVDQGMPGKLLALREREIKRQIIQTLNSRVESQLPRHRRYDLSED